jgi:hypothetical protein
VMTLQLRMIQFGAIANLIQVKFDGFKWLPLKYRFDFTN